MKQLLDPGRMTEKKAEWLLAALIIARSTSYLFSKICLQSMNSFSLLSMRSLLAFSFLAILLHKRFRHLTRSALFRGMLLGGTYFAVMSAELYGLRTTPSSVTSFLENTSIVFVPVIESVLHKKMPRPLALLSHAITLLGIGFLTLQHGRLALQSGELFCLLAAVLYACAIILTDRFARQEDPFLLGTLQVGFMGLFSTCAALFFTTPTLPSSGIQWLSVLYLAAVCSCFGFTLQPLAQSYVSSEKAGIFCALNPLTAALLGVVFLRETLSLQGIIGAGLILAGILISRTKSKS